MDEASIPAIAAALLGGAVGWRVVFRGAREARGREALLAARATGARPVSRHPQIDHALCHLCAGCIAACPETKGLDSPLAVVDGMLRLVNPTACVGHGECEAACPTGALKVTLGELAADPTIPPASPEGESARAPGIFVAGELSGTPLIRNAISQGKTAVAAIAERLGSASRRSRAARSRGASGADDPSVHDLVVVGLGPAGLAASLAAHERGLRYVALEQGELGGTVAHFPREKLIMTAPVDIPLYGRFDRRETSKEELLELWRGIAGKVGLRARVGERVQGVDRLPDGLMRVRAPGGEVVTRHVLLAIGRRGTPRRLGVPGEERAKVVYQVTDPALYRGRDALVVGGGDSAVEAAIILGKENRVTLSYRGSAFSRIKARNVERLKEAEAAGRVRTLLGSRVVEIGADDVALEAADGPLTLANDLVVVQAGGEPALPFLRSVGVVA